MLLLKKKQFIADILKVFCPQTERPLHAQTTTKGTGRNCTIMENPSISCLTVSPVLSYTSAGRTLAAPINKVTWPYLHRRRARLTIPIHRSYRVRFLRRNRTQQGQRSRIFSSVRIKVYNPVPRNICAQAQIEPHFSTFPRIGVFVRHDRKTER